MRDIDKIQRQVHYITAQARDPEETKFNNTWVYNRAPEGYIFELVKMQVSVDRIFGFYEGNVYLYDGHEYTHWNQWQNIS